MAQFARQLAEANPVGKVVQVRDATDRVLAPPVRSRAAALLALLHCPSSWLALRCVTRCSHTRWLAAAPRRLCRGRQVCHSKVEELVLPDELAGRRVDVLVSEPMGTLLVNERMLESYIYARDTFLAPGGKMFPVSGGDAGFSLDGAAGAAGAAAGAAPCRVLAGGLREHPHAHAHVRSSRPRPLPARLQPPRPQHLGRIHVAAFSDTLLHSELVAKALFWQQPAFYGLNMTPLHQAAIDGYFAQARLH